MAFRQVIRDGSQGSFLKESDVVLRESDMIKNNNF